MKTFRLLIFVLLPALAACGGYYGHALLDNSPKSLASCQIPGLELFVMEESFSEVENAKAVLQGLSTRFLTESRDKRFNAITMGGRNSKLHLPDASGQPALTEVIRDLEKAADEFKGTEQQLLVVQDLLWVLKQQHLFERWINVYLNALYEHPTHPLIGRFAQEAVIFGQFVGRESDVLSAFQHLSRIPLNFEAKRQVEALLVPTSAQAPSTHTLDGHRPGYLPLRSQVAGSL